MRTFIILLSASEPSNCNDHMLFFEEVCEYFTRFTNYLHLNQSDVRDIELVSSKDSV